MLLADFESLKDMHPAVACTLILAGGAVIAFVAYLYYRFLTNR